VSDACIALPQSGQGGPVRRESARAGRIFAALLAAAASLCATAAWASEAELKIPNLGSVSFLGI